MPKTSRGKRNTRTHQLSDLNTGRSSATGNWSKQAGGSVIRELTGCRIRPGATRQPLVAGRKQTGGSVKRELTVCRIRPRAARQLLVTGRKQAGGSGTQELTCCRIRPRVTRQSLVTGQKQAGGSVTWELTGCRIRPRATRQPLVTGRNKPGKRNTRTHSLSDSTTDHSSASGNKPKQAGGSVTRELTCCQIRPRATRHPLVTSQEQAGGSVTRELTCCQVRPRPLVSHS